MSSTFENGFEGTIDLAEPSDNPLDTVILDLVRELHALDDPWRIRRVLDVIAVTTTFRTTQEGSSVSRGWTIHPYRHERDIPYFYDATAMNEEHRRSRVTLLRPSIGTNIMLWENCIQNGVERRGDCLVVQTTKARPGWQRVW